MGLRARAADPHADRALPLPHPGESRSATFPRDGPFILAPNHFSNMDHFFAGVYMRRKIRFMAKSQLFFRNPVLDYIYRVGGVFPVRRGHHDEEAFVTAHSILDRGGCVLIYCEGGRSRTGKLGEAKPGARAAGARVRRAGGAGRDPRLAERARLEAARLPEGHGPVRRADDLRPGGRPEPRAAARRRRAGLRPGQGDVRGARRARPPRRDRGAPRGRQRADATASAQPHS